SNLLQLCDPSQPLWYLVAGIGKPRYWPVALGSKLVVKTRAVLADLFSSETKVPAGADQASPALQTFRSGPTLYVISPTMGRFAVKPEKARSVCQPEARSTTCCTISVSAGRDGRGTLASSTIVGSNGESCTAVVCGAPGGNRKLVRRRALPDPVLPAA